MHSGHNNGRGLRKAQKCDWRGGTPTLGLAIGGTSRKEEKGEVNKLN